MHTNVMQALSALPRLPTALALMFACSPAMSAVRRGQSISMVMQAMDGIHCETNQHGAEICDETNVAACG